MVSKHIRDARHHYSSGKHKSKPQKDTIAYPLGWLESKSQIIITVGGDLEKSEPSYTVSENVKWYSCLGKVW